MQIVKEIYDAVVARDPEQPEFHQAVWEVLESLGPALERHPEYIDMVKRVVEPERLIHFRVPWVDDNGNEHVNRGCLLYTSPSPRDNRVSRMPSSA